MLPFHSFATHAFVEAILQACHRQFPKRCSTCGRMFRNFGEYVKDTIPIGTPICFDEDASAHFDPIGTVSMVNCGCRTTLSLECPPHGEMYDRFVAALRADAAQYSITVSEVLESMRTEIRARALQDGVAPAVIAKGPNEPGLS